MTRAYTFDKNLQVSDGAQGAITATTLTATQVAGAAAIIDTGGSEFRGTLVVDVSALDTTTGDEFAEIHVQGSSSATFASGIEDLALIKIGGAAATGNSAADVAGLYHLSFVNIVVGTTYRYLRCAVKCGGTTPSVTIDNAWIGRQK